MIRIIRGKTEIVTDTASEAVSVLREFEHSGRVEQVKPAQIIHKRRIHKRPIIRTKSVLWQMFGKHFTELTDDEKYKYQTYMDRRYKNKRVFKPAKSPPNLKEWKEIFHDKDSLSNRLFGKPYLELTRGQKISYWHKFNRLKRHNWNFECLMPKTMKQEALEKSRDWQRKYYRNNLEKMHIRLKEKYYANKKKMAQKTGTVDKEVEEINEQTED